MTTTIDQAINKAETWAEAEWQNVKSAIHDEFVAIEPQLEALGETGLSIIWTAGLSVVMGGVPLGAALQVAIDQLEPELAHLAMAALAGAVQNLKAKQAAAS